MFKQWMKYLVGDVELEAARTLKRTRPEKVASNIVSKQDVYHHERNVLLLKSGQVVEDRTLESLHRQGVPVLDCCAIKQDDGSLKPLEEHVFKTIIARVERASENRQFTARMSSTLVDGAEDRVIAVTRKDVITSTRNTQAWQRHFKVLVVSMDKLLHQRLSNYLEAEQVLSQHIRPVIRPESFRYIYNKYQPTCLVVDDNTHYEFVKQGIDIFTLCESFPQDLEDIIMVRNEQAPVTPPRPSHHFKHHHLSNPIQRIDLKEVLAPITNKIKRLYSESTQVNLKIAEEL